MKIWAYWPIYMGVVRECELSYMLREQERLKKEKDRRRPQAVP